MLTNLSATRVANREGLILGAPWLRALEYAKLPHRGVVKGIVSMLSFTRSVCKIEPLDADMTLDFQMTAQGIRN